MNVPASALMDNPVDYDPLATEFALALRAEPRLAEIFTEALARVAAGRMSPTTFRELTAYAAYRINMDEGMDVDKEGPQQGVEDTS
jgi:hypothetical protein